jgi:hypothetical protein
MDFGMDICQQLKKKKTPKRKLLATKNIACTTY